MIMGDFKHYIITRFNVRVDEWKHTKNNESVLSDEWLEHRFQLFQTYCLPSVINQRNQDFSWLVFFDTGTANEYRKKIDEISESYENFTPIFINGLDALLPTLIGYISQDLTGQEYIITSRVDNDDCIHRDYVEEIQACFNKQESCVVDIVDGYQIILNETRKKQICEFRKARGYLNPFISLIEQVSNIKTIMSREHLNWKDSENIVTIQNKRLWGEIIHHKNKLNATRPLARPINHIDYSAFALSQDNIKLIGGIKYLKNLINVEFLRSYYSIKKKTPSGLKRTIKTIFKSNE